MNAAAPGVISLFQPNKHYRDDDAYLGALADAMAAEFRGIVDAGLVLQVDSPDLALGRQTMYAHLTEDEFVHRIGAHVAALNAALAGIPPERVRLHLCWGNYEGPHTLDVPIARLLPTVLGIRAGSLSFEGANPRHAHEWRVFEDIKLPEDKRIIPGVLDSSTNYVEHPDLVAERLLNYAGLVGRDRVTGRVGLRLLHLRRIRRCGPGHRVDETRRPGRGRTPRLRHPVEALMIPKTPGYPDVPSLHLRHHPGNLGGPRHRRQAGPLLRAGVPGARAHRPDRGQQGRPRADLADAAPVP